MKTLLPLIDAAIRRLRRRGATWIFGPQPALARIRPPRPRVHRRRAAFTLIELLVVIAIIGILAAMLFPAIQRAKVAAQVGQAKTDMANLGTAIKQYEADYNGRFPAPGIPTGVQDVTYGYADNALPGHYSVAQNRDVIAVLLNLERFPDGTVTTNAGKQFNPRGLTPLNAKYASDNTSGGIGPDGNYRDPWGGLYVISMDTSLNGRCRDNFYSRTGVSQDTGQKGHYGLSNPDNVLNGFEYAGQYMIWSRGPDGQVNPAEKANRGVNRDNVLGWQ
jgi:prepilin-type N-terminal cleavage/methylation domain-containing protein